MSEKPRRIRVRLHFTDIHDGSEVADITITYRDGKLPPIIPFTFDRSSELKGVLCGEFFAYQDCTKITVSRLCAKCGQDLGKDYHFDKTTEFCDKCKVPQKRVQIRFSAPSGLEMRLDYHEGRILNEGAAILKRLENPIERLPSVEIDFLHQFFALDTVPNVGIHVLLSGTTVTVCHLCTKCDKELTLEDLFDKTTALCKECEAKK